MRFFRHRKNLRTFLYLICLAVVLRSFIAPGYMLSIGANGDPGLAFCGGPVNMYQTGDLHDHHNEDVGTAESHISISCSFWSTSSVMVFNSALEVELVIVADDQKQIFYQSSNLHKFIINSHVIRGPPAPPSVS